MGTRMRIDGGGAWWRWQCRLRLAADADERRPSGRRRPEEFVADGVVASPPQPPLGLLRFLIEESGKRKVDDMCAEVSF